MRRTRANAFFLSAGDCGIAAFRLIEGEMAVAAAPQGKPAPRQAKPVRGNARQMQAAFGSAARLVQVEQSNQHGQLSSSRCARRARALVSSCFWPEEMDEVSLPMTVS